jgi:outer membrane receptor protein involved in Fe transport
MEEAIIPMKKSIFGLLLLIIAIIVRGAGTLEVKGRIVSLDGRPVAGAVVSVRSTNASAVADAAGGFTVSVPDGERIRLTVTHPDYFAEELSFSAKEASQALLVELTPLIRQTVEVSVTALRYPEPSTKIPAAQTVIPTALLEERLAPNITEALAFTPGVTPLGSGGFSLVPSIRGLARRRILVLVDNARITSDRRTGPNASFVNPEDLDRIEVLRSPSSMFYGSDAIGGVVNLFTKNPPSGDGISGRLHAGYGTNNAEKAYGLSLAGRKGTWGFYLSYQGLDADNYRSPQAEVLQSQYSQSGLLGKIVYDADARRASLSFLGSRGTDIGKPNRTSATKPTSYPHENDNLVQLAWTEKSVAGGELAVHAYANPNFLETRTKTLSGTAVTKDSFSRTESTEYGVQVSFARMLGAGLRLTAGADLFGRAGVKATLHEVSFDTSGNVTKIYDETAYDRGRSTDAGVFISADFSGVPNLDLVGGLRWDSLSQSAHPGGGTEAMDKRDDAVTGFLAASYRFTPSLMLFANAARAYRTPGLGERFYSGITGRGFIIAQPNLANERSLNWDAGLKWISPRLYAAAYGFVYTVDGLIDRYQVGPSIYTYGNVDKGRIKGVELEAEVYPLSGWKLFGTFAALQGESATTGAPINDIPPLRAVVGTRLWWGKFSAELSGIFQTAKDDPGPAEISIPACRVFQLKANYFLHPVNIYLVLGNIFDANYLGRPDPEAMEEPGRGLRIGLSYSFR